MCLRWTAAGMLEAERQFRRVIGYPKLPALAVAVERDIARQTAIDTPQPAVRVPTQVPDWPEASRSNRMSC